eukprot:GHVS01107572.1.p1 GENE.GHVS01107572.1~~GHVS01107572.1.p1  ORF type:complete len:583 (+),score=45.76 GHVS01107572.1:121-1869(+)
MGTESYKNECPFGYATSELADSLGASIGSTSTLLKTLSSYDDGDQSETDSLATDVPAGGIGYQRSRCHWKDVEAAPPSRRESDKSEHEPLDWMQSSMNTDKVPEWVQVDFAGLIWMLQPENIMLAEANDTNETLNRQFEERVSEENFAALMALQKRQIFSWLDSKCLRLKTDKSRRIKRVVDVLLSFTSLIVRRLHNDWTKEKLAREESAASHRDTVQRTLVRFAGVDEKTRDLSERLEAAEEEISLRERTIECHVRAIERLTAENKQLRAELQDDANPQLEHLARADASKAQMIETLRNGLAKKHDELQSANVMIATYKEDAQHTRKMDDTALRSEALVAACFACSDWRISQRHQLAEQLTAQARKNSVMDDLTHVAGGYVQEPNEEVSCGVCEVHELEQPEAEVCDAFPSLQHELDNACSTVVTALPSPCSDISSTSLDSSIMAGRGEVSSACLDLKDFDSLHLTSSPSNYKASALSDVESIAETVSSAGCQTDYQVGVPSEAGFWSCFMQKLWCLMCWLDASFRLFLLTLLVLDLAFCGMDSMTTTTLTALLYHLHQFFESSDLLAIDSVGLDPETGYQ